MTTNWIPPSGFFSVRDFLVARGRECRHGIIVFDGTGEIKGISNAPDFSSQH